MRIHRSVSVSVLFVGAILAAADRRAAAADFAVEEKADRLVITDGGRPVATYVSADKRILRPHFMHAHAPGGVQVTRNNPPIENKDATDHATFHPGIWMAFGDIGGQDVWRNKARVVHERFVEKPAGGPDQARFAVENRYIAADGKQVVCREIARFRFLARPAGYLLMWDSTFQSDVEFCFGDQEEMGLGVRVATPLAVDPGAGGKYVSKKDDAVAGAASSIADKGNGRILDSEGRINEPQIWGKSAAWCDYSGVIDGRRVGVTLMPDPANFRPSWFHARDYGLLVANPFGQKAFGKGPASKVVVKPGESFRLRYGVLLHAGPKDAAPDLKAAYADFLSQL